jgi:hypothetical protein
MKMSVSGNRVATLIDTPAKACHIGGALDRWRYGTAIAYDGSEDRHDSPTMWR